mgnify:CR=1 FL=1
MRALTTPITPDASSGSGDISDDDADQKKRKRLAEKQRAAEEKRTEMGKVSRQLIELKNAMQSDGEADSTMLGGLPHETTEEVLSLVVDPVDADAPISLVHWVNYPCGSCQVR